MLDSGFQSPGFRIPQAQNSWIPESGFPYMGRFVKTFPIWTENRAADFHVKTGGDVGSFWTYEVQLSIH